MDWQNVGGSWGPNFVGSWLVVLQRGDVYSWVRITHEINEYWTHTNMTIPQYTLQVQNYFGWNEHFFDSEKFLTTTSQSFCLVRRKCVNNVNNLNVSEFFKKIFKNVSQNYIVYCSHYNTVREYHCLTLGFGFGTIASYKWLRLVS